MSNVPLKPHFSIELPVPPSTNALHVDGGKRGRKKSKAYEEWLYRAGFKINAKVRRDGHPGAETTPYVIIEVQKPRADRDIDNTVKAIFDILVKHRIMVDDCNVPAFQACWSAKPADGECIARIAVYNAFNAPLLRFSPDISSVGRTGRWVVVQEEQAKQEEAA